MPSANNYATIAHLFQFISSLAPTFPTSFHFSHTPSRDKWTNNLLPSSREHFASGNFSFVDICDYFILILQTIYWTFLLRNELKVWPIFPIESWSYGRGMEQIKEWAVAWCRSELIFVPRPPRYYIASRSWMYPTHRNSTVHLSPWPEGILATYHIKSTFYCMLNACKIFVGAKTIIQTCKYSSMIFQHFSAMPLRVSYLFHEMKISHPGNSWKQINIKKYNNFL